jgi:hypothetical protein
VHVSLTTAVLLAFAVYRATRLLTTDSFPLMLKFRTWLLSNWPETPNFKNYHVMRQAIKAKRDEGETWRRPYWLGELLTCRFCASGYISLAACAVVIPFDRTWPIAWLGVWGGSVIIGGME